MSDNTPSSSQDSTPTPPAGQAPRRGPLIAIGVVAAALVAGGLALAFGLIPAFHSAPVGTLEAPESPEASRDLKRPDALIESASLSQLPKAVLEVPLLRDVLTEDFVFYYENNADRLGLAGTLRRIVYEHDLSLKDSVIEELLDQPAQVALWRGADGRLRDFMVVLRRGGLAKVLEPLAKVAADDSQLKKVAEIQAKGGATPVYSLRYGAEKTLLFISRGDQMLVLSNPKMLFAAASSDSLGEPDAAVAKDLGILLDGEQLFAKDFALAPRGELKQRITLGASVLAMGYQRFIPTFAGVRFEQGKDGWHSFLALNEVARQPELDFTPIWQTMPMGASACVALPVTPGLYDNMLVRLGAEQKMAAAFSEHLSGAAGLCWYPDSRLHSPLLAVKLDAPASPELDEELGKLFGSMIGAYEAQVEAGAFPVESRPEGDGRLWQRQVSSRFGQYPASEAENPDQVSGNGFFRVSLLRDGNTLLFSIDDKLLEKARNTLAKRFPPLSDVLPKDALVPAYIAPKTLSDLLQRETLDSLPQDIEPVFRNAADTLLLPRLKTLAANGSFALTLPAGSEPSGEWRWLPLEWKAL
ncbi:DUF2138 domain-containing protein [Pseudomonas sp. ZM23]|uniref:DUF2138 family protein n=1 Tax=Pseudomonas triclosanedens TaxID=2961893 RepID=A0ABY7A3A9_9PSED|nr:DUF2138 family protein [Pseudomonas triclosanedens]MCP8463781.1 DUF2138 domain-containing protein [Pseudomonas triclosanedens]MCP8468865.1 DUF2138 domain-containing protein [Pseudomonas triclosanedens]MCP8475587.1 DUF2138 domain-containing protein [Pseudomonas triclosanedens]WAI50695.1 DUF2138 family protein [Pseudomonas triclosanedens]